MTRLTPDPLLERVAHDAHAPALAARSATWTRGQLLEAADGLASALLGEGMAEGRRIACLLEDDAPMVALIHAARRLGAVLVPLNRRATCPELRAQLAAAGADILIHDKANADRARDSLPDGVAGHRIEALLAAAPCGPAPQLRERIDLDAPAAIVFTSGTTGQPKGAVLTHDNQRASAHAWAGLLRPVPGHRWLACLPLFHVAGLAIITRVTRWGAPLRLLDRFEPDVVSAALDDGVTHLSLVPTQLRALLDARAGRPAPQTLQAILLGGGPIPLELLSEARAAGYRVLTTYGMTETGSGVASGGAEQATLEDPLAGRALPGVELRIAADGSDDGSGEILVRGAMVFAGYLDDPQATAEVLRDGWLHTGDIGTLDEQGLLRVADRRDDLIISGGENVYPAEVEAVLTDHPAVAEAAVVGQPDARWGAVPVAFVVPEAEARPDPQDLQRHCRERLAAYKVPVRVELVKALPRNAFGKVQRHQLRERLSLVAP
jgi:O-succinylbenzoic acid--CoA ligase